MKRFFVVAFALVLSASVIIAAEAPASFKVNGLTFKRPASWEWVKTTSMMRKAQLKVNATGQKDSAEVVFFHFGPGDGGGVQANVDRWYGQFEGTREKTGAKSEVTAIGKHKVTLVQAHGTYLSGMPGGPRTPQLDYALRGAIIENDADGHVFIKMTGPSAIIKSSEGEFRKMIESALK